MIRTVKKLREYANRSAGSDSGPKTDYALKDEKISINIGGVSKFIACKKLDNCF